MTPRLRYSIMCFCRVHDWLRARTTNNPWWEYDTFKRQQRQMKRQKGQVTP